MQTQATGSHAHTTNAIGVHPLFTAEIDASFNPSDLTDDDQAEFKRIELHQLAYNELGRARHALLGFSGDYAGGIARAQKAIAAMQVLALIDGRA